jgi:pimeloyl-ACP methyl ester carboxylesterase
MTMTTERIAVSDVTLSVTLEGPDDGPLVVLLHGFPQNARTWRHVAPALAEHGYRVAAPDLRGYRASDRPKGIGAYALSRLVDDVAGLVHALGRPKAHVVGHDWGGTLAFATASRRPEVVDRLMVIDGAHPELYRTGMWHGSQLFRSWYVLFFQLPLLPELLVRSRFYLERVMKRAAPDAFPDDIMDAYVADLRAPGAARAAIDYYRAAGRLGLSAKAPILAPTRVLWGDADEALSAELLTGLDRYVKNASVRHFPGASHWLQEQRPDDVIAEALSFLT